MIFLSVEQVIAIHAEQIELFGGEPGIRSRELLESAVAMAEQGFGGEYLHAFPFEMAAAYAFHIAENQPFVDGNKRTGLDCALTFLDVNGWELHDDVEPTDEPTVAQTLYDAMIRLSLRAVDPEAGGAPHPDRLDKAGLALIFKDLAGRK